MVHFNSELVTFKYPNAGISQCNKQRKVNCSSFSAQQESIREEVLTTSGQVIPLGSKKAKISFMKLKFLDVTHNLLHQGMNQWCLKNAFSLLQNKTQDKDWPLLLRSKMLTTQGKLVFIMQTSKNGMDQDQRTLIKCGGTMM